MVHLCIFTRRKGDVTKEQFHRHWRDRHAVLASRVPGFRVYIQNHVLRRQEDLGLDGIVDIWMDSEAVVPEVVNCPEYKEGAFLDVNNFSGFELSPRLLTEDRVLLAGPRVGKQDRLGKAIFVLKRKPGTSPEEFHKHWLEVHGPLALKLPHLRRYVQCHTLPSAYAAGEPIYDGVAQLWFENPAQLQDSLRSLVAYVDLRSSLRSFADMELFQTYIIEEYRVIWPEDYLSKIWS